MADRQNQTTSPVTAQQQQHHHQQHHHSSPHQQRIVVILRPPGAPCGFNLRKIPVCFYIFLLVDSGFVVVVVVFESKCHMWVGDGCTRRISPVCTKRVLMPNLIWSHACAIFFSLTFSLSLSVFFFFAESNVSRRQGVKRAVCAVFMWVCGCVCVRAKRTRDKIACPTGWRRR